MGEHDTRRRFLRRSLAAAGFAAIPVRTASATADRSNALEIESEGGGVAAYEFTVGGSIRQEDSGDHVAGDRAYGHVGPDRGVDAFAYSGELAGFSLAGPARAYRNGYRVRPSVFPAPDGVPTAADFPPHSGTNELEIGSEGGGFGVYEFEATGPVRQLDGGDQVTGNRAYGHVGPERGVDEFEVAGTVTRFALAGPASVSLDGDGVTAGGGPRSVVRASPRREITATPETTVVFQALARGYRGDFPTGAWYVDGERRFGPDAFYGQLNTDGRSTVTHSFESPGTHRVRGELYDEGRARDEGAEPIGVVEWTVEIAADGNRPPTVERVTPGSATLTTSRDSTEEVEFAVEATDPDGELDRVVWWISQGDAVVTVPPANGSRDRVTAVHDPDPGLPFGAWAIDEDGALSEFTYWRVEEG